jgi:diguanylate cyclase (GGDEF)-like protein
LVPDDGTVILSIDDVHRRRLAAISLFGVFTTLIFTPLQIQTLGFETTGPFNLASGVIALAISGYALWTALWGEKAEPFIRFGLVCFAAIIWAEVILSGGITGYHAVMFPVLPVVGALLLRSRDTILFTLLNLLAMLAIAGLSFSTDFIQPLVVADSLNIIMTLSMLAITVLACAGAAFFMAHQNERIENQLRDLVHHQSHLAAHDHLSGLGNRVRLQQRFENTDPEQSFDVLLIDLDGFKAINDTYGHNAGDYLIKTFADRLREVTDSEDLLVRLGGDEFVIVLENVDGPLTAVRKYAEYLIEIVSRPYPWEGNVLRISASIGHARFPHHGRTASRVLSLADKALYTAKDAGKSQCVTYGTRPIPKPNIKKPKLEKRSA